MEYYECGKGWDQLILEAEALVEKYNIEHPDNEYPVEFTDIKEKWGYLHLYLNYYPDDLHNKLLQIEEKSKTICEYCGKPGNTVKLHGWIYTLCKDCQEKEIERYKNIFNKHYEFN